MKIRAEVKSSSQFEAFLVSFYANASYEKKFDDLSSFNEESGRCFFCNEVPQDEVILTTYLTSKPDPQRNIVVAPNDFSYMEGWYQSVMELGLHAIIFYDNLDPEFVKAHTNSNVSFVECQLGDLSLNDERFFLYLMYLHKYRVYIKSIFITDISDVIFIKSPFDLVKGPNTYRKIYVGRNNTNRMYHSNINLSRIDYISNVYKWKFPLNFFWSPIYNAGIIGGRIDVILYFLFHFCDLMKRLRDGSNLNMLILNIVLFQFFFSNASQGLVNWLGGGVYSYKAITFFRKIMYHLSRLKITSSKFVHNDNDRLGNSKNIVTSFPLHNAYKSYSLRGGEFIKHK